MTKWSHSKVESYCSSYRHQDNTQQLYKQPVYDDPCLPTVTLKSFTISFYIYSFVFGSLFILWKGIMNQLRLWCELMFRFHYSQPACCIQKFWALQWPKWIISMSVTNTFHKRKTHFSSVESFLVNRLQSFEGDSMFMNQGNNSFYYRLLAPLMGT